MHHHIVSDARQRAHHWPPCSQSLYIHLPVGLASGIYRHVNKYVKRLQQRRHIQLEGNAAIRSLWQLAQHSPHLGSIITHGIGQHKGGGGMLRSNACECRDHDLQSLPVGEARDHPDAGARPDGILRANHLHALSRFFRKVSHRKAMRQHRHLRPRHPLALHQHLLYNSAHGEQSSSACVDPAVVAHRLWVVVVVVTAIVARADSGLDAQQPGHTHRHERGFE